MTDGESGTAQPEIKVLRRTAISPKYIKADAELRRAAAQYFSAITAFAENPKRLDEASAKLKEKLVPKLGFDDEVDWRVVADERVKGGLIVEETERESTRTSSE